MLLKLKTLDQKIFCMEVKHSETVSEFISGIEDLMGEDNIYKVIYQGKLLKEGNTLADYNIDPKKCLILIISKPPKNAMVKTMTKPSNSLLARPTTLSLPIITDQTIDITYRSENDGTDSGYSSPLEPMEERLHPEDETAKEIYDDDDINKHYVTDDEFSIALDVIISSDYLKQDCDNQIMNKKDILKAVIEYSYDERPKDHLKAYILGKVNLIEEALLNNSQLHAFLNDIEDIYNEKRMETKAIKKTFDYDEMMFDIDLDEGRHKVNKELRERPPTPIEVKDFKKIVPHIKKGVTRHEIELAMRDSFESPREVSQYLDDIGFQQEQIEIALKTSLGSPDEAVDYLMTGTPPSHQENPLDFLRKNQEFRNIRIIVRRNPELLSSIIISFGNKNPPLHDLIYENKLSFVRLINEPETEYHIPEHQKFCR